VRIEEGSLQRVRSTAVVSEVALQQPVESQSKRGPVMLRTLFVLSLAVVATLAQTGQGARSGTPSFPMP
jgi:hypothetical protein